MPTMANYGFGPYEEAAMAGQARLNWRQRALGALQGLAFVRPGATPAEAFTQGLGGAARGISQAQMAAQEYAERQVAAEQARESRELDRQYKEALIDQMRKPPKPEKPEKKEPWERTPEEQAAILDWEKRHKVATTPVEKPEKPSREPLVQIAGPDGDPIYVPQSQAVGKKAPRGAAGSKPATGAEKQTLSYYNRMKTAEDTIQGLEVKMAKLPLPQQYQMRYAPNQFQSSDQQKYRQAQRAFTEARLRKESGAAIPQGEYDTDAQTYFAQPGDTAAVRAQKRAARKAVLEGLKFSSGRAFQEFYGETGGNGGNGGGVDLIYNPQTGELEPAR